MSEFGKRLKYLRRQRDLTQRDIANILKVSVSAVGMYERGEREPTIEMIERLADFFDVSLDYLFGRSNIPLPARTKVMQNSAWHESVNPIRNLIIYEDTVSVPVLGSIRAGQPVEMIQEADPEYEQVDKELIRHRDAFILYVRGDSMIGDQIYEGDRVVVICTPDFSPSDICVVAINGEEATLKRVKRQGDICILSSSNPNMEPMIYPAKDVHVIGIVVEVRRRINKRY
ncbi:LexA family protein [Alicyclobacillus mali (ex Roth et al. 2021)]|uniref:LexA family protein n=1 Tax=Alicyclobacillus mali (ex Roth et al. 2021) TaxID=1123961 RepID=UPI001A8D67AB|nr:S24 family peptidase [Alicyclobacillus mali (ex Roth et al. 2021)]